MKNKMHTLRSMLMVALLALAGSAAMAQGKLPAITLKTIDGKTVRTDQLSNDGKPFIVDFFATWCHPCNRELNAIAEVYEDWQAETGVKIYAVSIDQAHNINKVKPLADSHSWTYDILLDPNSDFCKALGVRSIPHTLVLDGKGNIVYQHSGYADGVEEELIEKVRELVNAGKSKKSKKK